MKILSLKNIFKGFILLLFLIPAPMIYGQVVDDVIPPELLPEITPSFALDENCVATLLNRNIQVNPEGTFSIPNFSVPNGQFRVRVVCDRGTFVEIGKSEFFISTANQTLDVGTISKSNEAPIPVSLSLAASAGTLTSTVPTTQITTTGNLAGGITVDLTASTTGTSYTSSNAGVATVNVEGLVTAVSSGTVFITAINEGAVATISIQVVLGDDTDGDGLPNDFENANLVNPGGANASLFAGTAASAHSEETGNETTNAIDGNSATVWRASASGSPTFFEVVLPIETNVAQVRLVGDPAHTGGAVEFFPTC